MNHGLTIGDETYYSASPWPINGHVANDLSYQNHGTLYINGTFTNNDYVKNDWEFYINGTFINNDVTHNNVLATFTNDGTFINNGTFINQAHHYGDHYVGKFNNNGTFINDGIFINEYSGIFNHGAESLFTGSGVFRGRALTIDKGRFRPEEATVETNFTLQNSGTLEFVNPGVDPLLTVTGTTSLSGGNLTFSKLPKWRSGSFTLIDGQSTLTVNDSLFDDVDRYDSLTHDYELVVSDNDLVLTVDVDPISSFDLDGWRITGTGDFDGDGDDDMLIQEKAAAGVGYIEMQDSQYVRSHLIVQGWADLLGWELIDSGDFDRDGTDDLLWQNKTTNQVDYWKMQDGQVVKGSTIDPGGAYLDEWDLAGSGDFDGDGTDDLLWRNKNTGQIDQWKIYQGEVFSGDVIAASHAQNKWTLVGTMDIDGDSVDDLLWQEKATGRVNYWEIGVDPGKRDVLVWQRSLNGQPGYRTMNRPEKIGGGTLLEADGMDPSFKLIGSGDFNSNDGSTVNDLIFQNNAHQVFIIDDSNF